MATPEPGRGAPDEDIPDPRWLQTLAAGASEAAPQSTATPAPEPPMPATPSTSDATAVPAPVAPPAPAPPAQPTPPPVPVAAPLAPPAPVAAPVPTPEAVAQRPSLQRVPVEMSGRYAITDISPAVLSGRRPAAAAVGELIAVQATCFREGHDALGAHVVLRDPQGSVRQRVRMQPLGQDRWMGAVRPDAMGPWTFEVEAWGDPWSTWQHRAGIKIPAAVDVELEFEEGAILLERAAALLPGSMVDERERLTVAARTLLSTELPDPVRLAAGFDPQVARLMHEHPIREFVTVSGPWPLSVQRRRALVGAWYEMFPRSEGASVDPPRSGTFATAAERLPAIAAMGFDVVYLPPVHPIGYVNRKGPNNTLTPGPADPGCPWAIGSAEGGHDAIHPDLGTIASFDAFVQRLGELGMEVALDLALQAAPDHPWVRAHPEWFTTRADGSIAYAENPPKKYQDIYPLNFDIDPEGLYAEIERVVRFWVSHGVRIFRVDNPHTKPLWAWERLIAAINSTHPDVLFLAEAFTKPHMMKALAEIGFQQSYTYFTWRNTREEVESYLTELAGPAAAYMRPNFFANTPDILPEYLQHGGPNAFAIRAVLAATLSPSYGIYSGFELFEHVSLRPGSEEYLDSEKYQYRPRDWAAADASGLTLAPLLTRLNAIRREHPALQDLRSVRFHDCDNSNIIAFSKRDGDDIILVACTVDPYREQQATIRWDMPEIGLTGDDKFVAHDLISGRTWTWSQGTYVRLNPAEQIAHVVHVVPV